MLPIESKLYFKPAANWVLCPDVLQSPPLTWEYGIIGDGPVDLLASTGFLSAYLDNSRSNAAAKDGYYSPDHANLLVGFEEGMPVKVTLPNHGDWIQEFRDDMVAFDGVSPAWDSEVNEVADFDAEVDADGDLNDSAVAAHDGDVGLEFTFDDHNVMYGTMNAGAVNQTKGVATFWINLNTIAATGSAMHLWGAVDGINFPHWWMGMDGSGKLYYRYRNDAGGVEAVGSPFDIGSGWHNILIMWSASTGVGNDDGFMYVFTDGELTHSGTGHDNDTRDWDYTRNGNFFSAGGTPAGSFYMDTIKIDPVGAPFADALAAYNGTHGLAIPILDNTALRYGLFTDPTAETILIYEFWIDPNTITMATDDSFIIAQGDSAYSSIRLGYNGSNYTLISYYRLDDAAYYLLDTTVITDEFHHVRVEWGASTGAGLDDGYVHIYIDGVLEDSITGLDNDTHTEGGIYFGAVGGLDAGTYGIFYMDRCRWSNLLEQIKFIGTLTSVRPAPGLFEHPAVEIEAQDWIGYLSNQELGIIQVASTKRADEALTTAMANFAIAPEGTDFGTGVETFLLVFNTDTPETSMANFFQKMCRNELGRVYTKGNGTIVFEKRNVRSLITYADFEIDSVMTEVTPSYERTSIFNIFEAKFSPMDASVNPDVQIWDLKVAEYFGGVIPAIAAGETLVFKCPFTDPALNTGISAINVVDPIEVIEFGSVADFESNDMIGDLVQGQDIGANLTVVTLENTHVTDTGYLNDLQIYGRALYAYGSKTVEARNQASIDSGLGEKRFTLRLEHIVDEPAALVILNILLAQYKTQRLKLRGLKVLANQTAELRAGLIGAEVSTRFTLAESVTGIDRDLYINRLKYTQRGPNLWVEVDAAP